MARVVALIPDLLFGSNVQGMLRAAGHEVQLTADPQVARAQAPMADLLILDLTTTEPDGAELVRAMRAGDELGSTRTLAFYSHVDAEARARGEESGIELVVPRSRMAREAGALVAGLTAGE